MPKIANQNKGHLSSAEMTAYWRSAYHNISKDHLSREIATEEGIDKALQFEHQYHYPLVGRKVSVRARFFLDEATRLINTNKYDSCISLASGFSLLTTCINKNINQSIRSIKFIDTDLREIIDERNKRLDKLFANNVMSQFKNIHIKVLDLELACSNKLSLKKIFNDCNNPIFLIEGVIYFLSSECVKWLINEISLYNNAALMLDYWQEDGVLRSKCFSRIVSDLQGFMKENVVSFFTPGFWSQQSFANMMSKFINQSDIEIMEAEHQYSVIEGEASQFIDQNQFFPVKLFSGELRKK